MKTPLGGLPEPPLTSRGDAYHFTAPWVGWFSVAQYVLQDVSSNGPTSQRPTTNLYVGKRFFDTTLGIPIWLKSASGPVWVNGAGTPV